MYHPAAARKHSVRAGLRRSRRRKSPSMRIEAELVLHELPPRAGRDHARYRRHLRCRARSPAIVVVQRAPRRTLLLADPHLRRNQRQAGGGGHDPGGRRRAVRGACRKGRGKAALLCHPQLRRQGLEGPREDGFSCRCPIPLQSASISSCCMKWDASSFAI